jgi:hypothetical protein
MVVHWSTLSERLGPGAAATALDHGVAEAGSLIAELKEITARYRLFGSPAAQGAGVHIAGMRNGLGDLFLERNQALRLAALDVTHLILLLAYLDAVARDRDDEGLASFCSAWQPRMEGVAAQVRAAVLDLARDPDGAIEPATPSSGGRAAHRLAHAAGTLGEWFDRRAADRRRAAAG